MTRFGAHAFTWEPDWSREGAQRAIFDAAEAGLDFIEIPLLHPESFDAGHTKQLLDSAGLGATCSLGLPPSASLPAHPDAAVSFLQSALEQADRVDSTLVSGVIYGTLGALPGRAPVESELETIGAALKRVARFASRFGIRLGLEPVNRYETSLLNTVEQAMSMLDRIDEPNVTLHLDTYHMNIEEKGFANAIKLAGSRLGYVHLSESDRGTPGTGNVDWDDVFTGLAAVEYSGDLAMESFVAVNPEIARATCMWREVAPSSDELVRQGLAFLRAKASEYGLM